MNKQSIVSNFKTATLSLLFATAFATTSFAGGTEKTEAASSKNYTVNYIGNVEDGYVFTVKFDNITGENFDLVIKDEAGEVLYSKEFAGKNFNKRFQLSKAVLKANFIVRPEHGAEQNFEVTVQSRTTEDVVVSRQ